MSLEAFVAVNRCPSIKGAARRVAFQLADAHNKARGDAWPGYRLMAAREGVTTKTMETGVRMLEEAGFLLVQRRPGRSNYYRLDVEQIATLAVNTLADCQPQNTVSPPNVSSVEKHSDQSTEADFGTVQKRTSLKSSINRLEQSKAPILNPDAEHYGRLRKDWARDLAFYRKRLSEGAPRPFWLSSLGPPPDASGCRAPLDLMQRYGFGEVISPRDKQKSLSRP